MARYEAESGRHRILASDVVPVQVAGLLRHVQSRCDLGRGIVIKLEVDESLYVSAVPELLVYALDVLLGITGLDQPAGAIITLGCHTSDDGIRVEAEGEPLVPEAPTSRPIPLDLTFASQALAAMNGSFELSRDAHSGQLFALTLNPARPSRISSRPPRV